MTVGPAGVPADCLRGGASYTQSLQHRCMVMREMSTLRDSSRLPQEWSKLYSIPATSMHGHASTVNFVGSQQTASGVEQAITYPCDNDA